MSSDVATGAPSMSGSDRSGLEIRRARKRCLAWIDRQWRGGEMERGGEVTEVSSGSRKNETG